MSYVASFIKNFNNTAYDQDDVLLSKHHVIEASLNKSHSYVESGAVVQA